MTGSPGRAMPRHRIRRAVVDATAGAERCQAMGGARACEKTSNAMPSTARRRRAPDRSDRIRPAAAGTVHPPSPAIPPDGSTRRSRNDRGRDRRDPAGPSGASPTDGADAAIAASAASGVGVVEMDVAECQRKLDHQRSKRQPRSRSSAQSEPAHGAFTRRGLPAAGTCRRSQTSNNVTLRQSAETRLRLALLREIHTCRLATIDRVIGSPAVTPSRPEKTSGGPDRSSSHRRFARRQQFRTHRRVRCRRG